MLCAFTTLVMGSLLVHLPLVITVNGGVPEPRHLTRSVSVWFRNEADLREVQTL
jgi:hypothetical protein